MRIGTFIKSSLTVAALACGMAMSSSAQAQNLILNPSFETPNASAGDVANAPGTPWAGFNQGSLRYTTASQAHTGTQSVKTFGPFDGIGGGVGATQNAAGVAGASYTGSIFAKQITGDALVGNNFGTFQINFLSAANANLGTFESTHFVASSPIDTWTKLSVTTPAAPAGTAFVQAVFVQVQLGDGNGNITGGAIYWDDASVALAPEPTSIAFAGLAGLGLLNRRRRA